MKVIPTLSSSGYAVTVPEKVTRIISYYISLNYSQTTRYRGNVYSLQHAVFRSGGDMSRLASTVQLELGKILTRNFPEGSNIEVEAIPLEKTETYNLRIDATVMEGGKQYSIGKEINSIHDILKLSMKH